MKSLSHRLPHFLVLSCLLLSFLSAPASAKPTLEALKMQKRFGIGFSAGGMLSVFGVEADINFSEDLSISGGLGTGIDYSTFMVKGRYFLLGEWVSPYVAASIGRWWTNGTNEKSLGPSVLVNRFLPAGYDYSQGFSVFLISPSIGVQYMHPVGFAVSFELQYLFRLFTLGNGTYASLAGHWYF